jgi:hypothetical protein
MSEWEPRVENGEVAIPFSSGSVMNTKLGFVVTAGVLMLLTLDLVAAERATFILRDGQRASGTLVAHGDQRANLVLGYFNLGDMPGGTGNLRERAYPEADVAVIDFAGGVPPQQELAGLNRMNGQPNMLTLRSGAVLYGRFDNIIEGSTVAFTDQRGQHQAYSARDVARVYLDTAAARAVFDVAPDPVPNGQTGDWRSGGNPTRQTTEWRSGGNRDLEPLDGSGPGLRVLANRAWTDTGIAVRRGEQVRFRASGQIQFGESDRDVTGTDGNPRFRLDPSELPVALMPIGGLIGRVGRGAPFPIGSNPNSIVMPDDGRLYLGVNARAVPGNRGAFLVEVLPGRW